VGLAVLIELAVLNGRAVAGLRTESVLTY
jgi:hypothetical protein